MTPTEHVIVIRHADDATADKDTYVPAPAPGNWEIVEVSFTPDSDGAVTADNTEWRKLTWVVGSVELAQVTTDANGSPAGASLVAGTPATLGTALNAAAANPITSAIPLKLVSLHGGSTAKVLKGVSVTRIRRMR